MAAKRAFVVYLKECTYKPLQWISYERERSYFRIFRRMMTNGMIYCFRAFGIQEFATTDMLTREKVSNG